MTHSDFPFLMSLTQLLEVDLSLEVNAVNPSQTNKKCNIQQSTQKDQS